MNLNCIPFNECRWIDYFMDVHLIMTLSIGLKSFSTPEFYFCHTIFFFFFGHSNNDNNNNNNSGKQFQSNMHVSDLNDSCLLVYIVFLWIFGKGNIEFKFKQLLFRQLRYYSLLITFQHIRYEFLFRPHGIFATNK